MKFNHLMKYTSLLLAGLLAGNALLFALGMRPVIEKLSASSYIVFHEAIQRSFLSWVPMFCVFLVLVLTFLLASMHKRNLEFLLVLFALLCAVEELFTTWTASYPLEGIQTNWGGIRTQWLHFMYWHCALLIVGFFLLLASMYAGKAKTLFSVSIKKSFKKDAVAVS